MIIYSNGKQQEYFLNECEKQEIENLYRRGGRYLYWRNTNEYVDIYTESIDGSLGQKIARVLGDTVKVLNELGNPRENELISLFDIMQLYPNDRQIKLTEYDKNLLRYIYDKLGGRYIKQSVGKYLVYNVDNHPLNPEFDKFDKFHNLIFYLDRFAVSEISDERGISLERIINKFCK